MKDFKQAKWDEPLILELSHAGRRGYVVPRVESSLKHEMDDPRDLLPRDMHRRIPPELPEVSEVEVVRHFTRLSQMNYGVDLGLYPLGSCTMKYNPKINDALASLPKIACLHPYQDERSVQGILEILHSLGVWLAEITGTSKVSLQPAAGAQGEFLGALMMREFHKINGDISERTEIIIPDSAHGTNPASAAMAGFDAVIVPSSKTGCLDIDVLKSVASEKTAGLMITNPNTLGIFEKRIEEAAAIIHEAGGLLYYDGANLNAILGKARPGDMGFDIVHINIHKTFGTPHGGGGPGAGPIGVSEELEKFLPIPRIVYDGENYHLDYNRPHSVGKMRSFYGNIAVLIRAYAYILCLGAEGLREAAEISVLNANYVLRKIAEINAYDLPYDAGVPRKHEGVISASPFKNNRVRALDISKRLLDFGIHAPTIYFPSIVQEALMIEPTESFEREELDNFVEAMRKIAEEAEKNKNLLLNAPRNTTVGRLDEVKASHPRTMLLSWNMLRNERSQSNIEDKLQDRSLKSDS
ncbi:MAG: aminomethyl-transferring glycine dehydrogenase subunit GcvPB [Candidatus Bathyarchaeota archaeon]|nr:MAG: aminomethyl-transferring glycine dehydrogenase subunit GcvPB [Candidatus Bathyarchaeota archaeon]